MLQRTIKFDPIYNDYFTIYNAVDTPKIELNLPTFKTPLDISGWATTIKPNGKIIPKGKVVEYYEPKEDYIIPNNPNPGAIEETVSPETSPENNTPSPNDVLITPKKRFENYSGTSELSTNLLIGGIQLMNLIMLKDPKIKPHQAAAIVGHLAVESSFNSRNVNPNDNNKGKSIGLVLWNGKRKDLLIKYAQSEGKEWTDPNILLDFMIKELKDPKYGSNLEKEAYNMLLNSTNITEASNAWGYYERYDGYNGKSSRLNRLLIQLIRDKRLNAGLELYKLWRESH